MAADPDRPERVATAPTEIQAAIYVNLLQDHGIEARSVGDFTSGFRAEAPGVVSVYVRQRDAERAREILQTAAESTKHDEAE